MPYEHFSNLGQDEESFVSRNSTFSQDPQSFISCGLFSPNYHKHIVSTTKNMKYSEKSLPEVMDDNGLTKKLMALTKKHEPNAWCPTK